MVNQVISAARYNVLQSRISNLLGVGVGDSGYNQAVSSSQVPKSNIVSAIEINQIYSDLIKIRTHQVGSEPTNQIKQVNSSSSPITIANAYINTGNNDVVTIETSQVHKLIDGTWVDYITGVAGMGQLNGVSGYAKILSTTEFELYSTYERTSFNQFTQPIGDSTWGAYFAGGSFTHTISEEIYYAYESLTTTCENSKHNVDATQADPAIKNSSTRTDLWGGTATPQTVTHEFIVSFTSSAERRGFFNAGGELRFNASLINFPSSGENANKSANWNAMLSNMGTIKFNYTETTSSVANGTGSSIGNFDLTSAYQVVYTKAGSDVYIENEYVVKAKEVSASQIQFLIEFNDDANGVGGADERVEGTLSSVLTEYRATGPYVESQSPTITIVSNL